MYISEYVYMKSYNYNFERYFRDLFLNRIQK